MGWGKRILILLICGIVLGGSAACAFVGVNQLIDKFDKEEEVVSLPSEETHEVIQKEPEIEKVEPVIMVTPQDQQAVGVVYDVSGVVENVMPAMVSVINNYTETISSFWGQSYTQQGASSGSQQIYCYGTKGTAPGNRHSGLGIILTREKSGHKLHNRRPHKGLSKAIYTPNRQHLVRIGT